MVGLVASPQLWSVGVGFIVGTEQARRRSTRQLSRLPIATLAREYTLKPDDNAWLSAGRGAGPVAPVTAVDQRAARVGESRGVAVVVPREAPVGVQMAGTLPAVAEVDDNAVRVAEAVLREAINGACGVAEPEPRKRDSLVSVREGQGLGVLGVGTWWVIDDLGDADAPAELVAATPGRTGVMQPDPRLAHT